MLPSVAAALVLLFDLENYFGSSKAAATSEGGKRLSVEQVRRTGDAGRDLWERQRRVAMYVWSVVFQIVLKAKTILRILCSKASIIS